MFDLSAVALLRCNLFECFERFALKLILPYVGCIDIFSLVELHFAFFKAESVGYVSVKMTLPFCHTDPFESDDCSPLPLHENIAATATNIMGMNDFRIV